MLLVLDNFEQLVSAAPLISDLLSSCTDLSVIVTSREVLRLQSEHTYPVPPLELPESGFRVPEGENIASVLSQYEAVRLFIRPQ